MPRPGSNLPGFRETQLEFAAHIRNPDTHARPSDVEARRMRIYVELFYNNIEGFLASGFPVCKQVLGTERWHQLVREFVHRHGSESPYFLEISQEFLTFLAGGRADAGDLPPFLLELAHYEWVELALGVSELESARSRASMRMRTCVRAGLWFRRSSGAWPIDWPVHEIGPGHVPETMPRAAHSSDRLSAGRNDQVSFMEVSAATLQACREAGRRETLQTRRWTGSPWSCRSTDSKVVYEQGLATLERLREAEIVLGVSIEDHGTAR